MQPLARWIALLVVASALTSCKREAPVATAPPAPPSSPGASVSAPASAPEPAKPESTTSTVAGVAITSATLGSAINADKRVTAATDTFRPADTIFVTVETSGTAGANLTARWTYSSKGESTRVNEETQKVPPGGPAVTEFHVRKPDGWPPGEYQVVVLVNDEVSVTRKFSVK